MKQFHGLIILLFLIVPGTLLNGAPIKLSIPDTSGIRGDYIDLPVIADSSFNDENVTSYHLEITFNDNYLDFEEAIVAGSLTETLGFFEFNQTETGRIEIAAAGNSALAGKGTLIKLRFLMTRSGTANINFTDSESNYFNEGLPEIELDNGRLIIANPPSINITPDSRLLTIGDTYAFSVSGGTSPYTWNVTNSSVAEIASNGVLTATHHGYTRVTAEDNLGIRDTTTGEIEIRAFKIWINDTSLYQDQSISIPLRISPITGLGVTSGTIEITSINESRLDVVDISTEGTVLQSYNKPSFLFEDGKLKIAFAGSEPLEGSGVLVYIEFKANMESYGTSALNLAEPIFNENLLGNVDNGSCRVIQLPDLDVNPLTALPPMNALLPGDMLGFTVNGGFAPYSWSTSNPEVATIDETGMLTALRSGTVTILVEDNIGAQGTSNLITVYDTEIWLPDTTLSKGMYHDIPVFIRPLPSGKELLAFEASVELDTSFITQISINTAGTLCEGNWRFAKNYADGFLNIAGASSSSITEGGIFFYLRFFIPAEVSNGTDADILFENIVLNEGDPTALSSLATIGTITSISSDPGMILLSDGFYLYQNYPNPFNPKTRIPLKLSKKESVIFEVFDNSGKLVSTVDMPNLDPGLHYIDWNGSGKASGTYYISLRSLKSRQVRKMLYIR